MKYLFVNSVAGFGSTGRIAADKCRELMAQGHQCLLAYGRNKTNCDDIPTFRIGTEFDFRFHGIMNRIFDDHGFYSVSATKRFLKAADDFDPDVLWLHNIHGYYINIELLFGWIKSRPQMKVCWTLHDCWAFTGHCSHFSYVKCDKWQTGCFDCPQKKEYPASLVLDNSRGNYEKKKALFTGVKNMTIYTPSQWLKELVEKSFLGEYPVEVIHNEVNRDVFKSTPSDFRAKHDLENKKIILGVSSVWTDRKGLPDILELATLIDEGSRIILVGLTPEQAAKMPGNVLCIPRTNSQQELAEIYTAADVFINPSYEETFGLTTLEALCCGTPAIVYKDTACEEVADMYGGVAVESGAKSLLEAVRSILAEGDKR